MSTEYFVKSQSQDYATSTPVLAAIVTSKAEGKPGEALAAELYHNPDGSYSLTVGNPSAGASYYWLTERVDGEIRPFSLEVWLKRSREENDPGELVLKIKDRMFSLNGKEYIISNVSESKPHHHYVRGPKFISRLDALSQLDAADRLAIAKSRAERRLRGVHVGELSGLGTVGKGHQVKILSKELQSVGLLLAVASFLINTTRSSLRVPAE